MVRRAIENTRCEDVIGITLSRNRTEVQQSEIGERTQRQVRRLQGWDGFTDKVDRILSIGASFGIQMERYAAFFERSDIPDDTAGCCCALTYTRQMHEMVSKVTTRCAVYRTVRCTGGGIFKFAQATDFSVEKVQLLQQRRTLNIWAANLEANKGRHCSPRRFTTNTYRM